MLIDLVVLAALSWLVAKALNMVFFKAVAASNPVAWTLTIAYFLIGVVIASVLKVIRHSALNTSLGLSPSYQNPLDMATAFLMAYIFYQFLNRPAKALLGKVAKAQGASIPALPTSSPTVTYSTTPLPIPASGLPRPTTPSPAPTRPPPNEIPEMEDTEDRIYAQVGEEIESGNTDKATWTRAFSQAGGDDRQTRVLYIQARVERLMSAERLRLEVGETQRANAKADVDKLIARFIAGGSPTVTDVNRLLLECRAAPSILTIRDRLRGNTLLHWCAMLGLDKEATTLISSGADANAVNGNGRRPFEVAEVLALRAVLLSASDAQSRKL